MRCGVASARDIAHRASVRAPRPRIAEARWLAERGARAAIDVSDGLVADAGHLARRAACASCSIAGDAAVRSMAWSRKRRAASGEEYELLVAFAPEAPPDTAAFREAVRHLRSPRGRSRLARDVVSVLVGTRSGALTSPRARPLFVMRTVLTALTVLVADRSSWRRSSSSRACSVCPRASAACRRGACAAGRAADRAAGGAKVVVHDPERMLRDRGAVYVSNHVSWFDVFAIASVLPRYTFVAKAELRKLPLFGWGAEAAGVVFLERENRKAAFEAYEGAASAGPRRAEHRRVPRGHARRTIPAAPVQEGAVRARHRRAGAGRARARARRARGDAEGALLGPARHRARALPRTGGDRGARLRAAPRADAARSGTAWPPACARSTASATSEHPIADSRQSSSSCA